MWKDIFSNTQTAEEEEQDMLEDLKKPRARASMTTTPSGEGARP